MRGGVGLSLAFLMIFLGKWLRRSKVMTSAEWMKLRFGTDKQGRLAHVLSAVANIVLSLGMIVYFAKGAGKFLTHFIPISEFWCTSGMVTIGLLYTLASGLYGVVFTDVVQMILLTFTAIFVTVTAFSIRDQVVLPDGLLDLNLEMPSIVGNAPVGDDIIQLFGLCVVMYVFRTVLEGMGGVGGYTDQRFFAARNEREASLLTLEAIVLSILRWTMVAGLVIMGLKLVQDGHPSGAIIAGDPEQVLPVVLGELLPAGVRGVVLAGLIAAAMSTFDSTLNAGASYIVRDIYQSYVKPDADQKQLVRVSWVATIGLCVAGVGLAAIVPSIDKVWNLITMGLGAGLFVPLFLRWYWPRFNGYGFAIATGVGIVTGLIYNQAFEWPLYYAFPATVGTGFIASVVGALMTSPVSDDVLTRFCLQTNPGGLWERYRKLAVDRGWLTREKSAERLIERLNDMIAVFMSVPFQVSVLLAAMALVFHDWTKFSFFLIISLFCAVGLYFFWYRNLKTTAQCEAEDAEQAATLES